MEKNNTKERSNNELRYNDRAGSGEIITDKTEAKIKTSADQRQKIGNCRQ